MHSPDRSDAVRWLLVAAVLTVALSLAGGGGPLGSLVQLALLGWVWRGGHVAWVLSCTFATAGALLLGYVALVDAWYPGGSSAQEGALPLALGHAALVVVLTAAPVRRRVGRARPLPAPAA